MNEKQKNYILDNCDKYGIKNEQGELLNREKMLALLNILEVHGQTLDSFHDVAFNGYSEFCEIVGRFENDSDVYRALLEFNVFIPRKEFPDFMVNEYENAIFCGFDSVEQYFDTEDLRESTDGFVNVLHY